MGAAKKKTDKPRKVIAGSTVTIENGKTRKIREVTPTVEGTRTRAETRATVERDAAGELFVESRILRDVSSPGEPSKWRTSYRLFAAVGSELDAIRLAADLLDAAGLLTTARAVRAATPPKV